MALCLLSPSSLTIHYYGQYITPSIDRFASYSPTQLTARICFLTAFLRVSHYQNPLHFHPIQTTLQRISQGANSSWKHNRQLKLFSVSIPMLPTKLHTYNPLAETHCMAVFPPLTSVTPQHVSTPTLHSYCNGLRISWLLQLYECSFFVSIPRTSVVANRDSSVDP